MSYLEKDIKAVVADVASDTTVEAAKVKETLKVKFLKEKFEDFIKEEEAKLLKGEKADIAKLKALWNELVEKLVIK
jgi:hypothetical protein